MSCNKLKMLLCFCIFFMQNKQFRQCQPSSICVNRIPIIVKQLIGVSTNTLLSFCSTCSKFSHYTTNISSNEVSFCVCFAGYETYSCTACKVRPTPRRISCVLLETKLLLSFVLLSITHDPSRANVLSSTLFGTLPFPRNSIALQWHSAASVLKV